MADLGMGRAVSAAAVWVAAFGWAALGTFGTLGSAEAAQKKQVTEKVFPFEPGGSLRIQSQNGNITIETWSEPRASVQITRIAKANEEKQVDALLREMQADVTLSTGHIEIVSRFPKRSESVGLWDILGQRVTSMNIHYHVKVPARTGIELDTTNGDLKIRGVASGVTGRTLNGSVEVRGIKGPVEVETTNGSIHLAGIEGSASAETTNGTIEAVMHRVDAAGQIVLSTTNGSVTASLPEDLKANVDAETTNGRVRVAFPVKRLAGSTARALHATIGGGGVDLTLRTTNGNIVIQKIGTTKGT
ncbi:MAG TPA: DUF4097 family beta strand repeat-containing protein [Candidatus Eisenbacteria bacterium]|nr:DUF4097 family beta strand repeat-containing protein [Candidatus Eisenbacteria bacterium]